MSHFAIGCRQVWGGLKTMFGYSAKRAAQSGAQKVAQQASYKGPAWSEICARQPLALPAPTAAQLAKDVPTVCVPKVLNGLNLSELRMSQEILKDGTHVRYFRAPGNNKILLKMEDKGVCHKEWIYGTHGRPDNITFIKTVGNGDRYVCIKNGNHVQVQKEAIKYKDGINQKVSTNDLYYSDTMGTGYHYNVTNGYNGVNASRLDIQGKYPDYRYVRDEAKLTDVKQYFETPYKLANVENKNHDIQQHVVDFFENLYRTKSEDAYLKVLTDINNAQAGVKANFIDDIQESLFAPYRA